MPRRRTRESRGASLLSKRLVLNSYICGLLGVRNFRELRSLLHDVDEGFDNEGRSYIFHALLSRARNLKIPINKLEEYDSNIRNYVDYINKRREMPIKLKYFQYLAVLFTEIYLDMLFSDPVNLLRELNAHVSRLNIDDDNATNFYFSKKDLRKLSFWMATGSGKTLIFHINFLQFMKYNKGPHALDIDNILLITPSEMLSNQHIDEMRKSSIPCGLFSDYRRGYFSSILRRDVVQVLDIHKFTEEKKGSGVTIDVEEFGNRNLVFVDEGHKGSGGEKWRRFREFVARDGFTFEYSATFGQAIAGNPDLLPEYGKSILFDYSYPHFYNDGYGKDYRILNLKREIYDDVRNTLLLANALSFYEQRLAYDENPQLVQRYNIEPPLWIFVGSKVSAKSSDVLEVIRFLSKLLTDREWAIQTIQRILEGRSGIIDNNNRDIFSPDYPEQKLAYLRMFRKSPEEIYKDMLSRIFHINGPAPLHLVNLKGVEGEIGLRAGSLDVFFGVINIGDVSKFLKYAEEKGFDHMDHDFAHSLFDDVKKHNSPVNILIGANKFREGWSSWRVSNMGLLNVGKSEGSQIIQLFGRGVRLKGLNHSLKRSSVVDPNLPPSLRLPLKVLETLNIFGIKANYMEHFRDYLREEGIEDYTLLEFPLQIEVNHEFLNKGLLIPKIDTIRFAQEEFFEVTGDESVSVTVDLAPKAEVLSSIEEPGIQAETAFVPRHINKDVLNMLDWQEIYLDLMKYRTERGWYNMAFSMETLKKIMIKDNTYTLYCPEKFVQPRRFEDLQILKEVVVSVLKKYLREVYNQHRRVWSQRHVEIAELDAGHGNLNFEKYILKVKEEDQAVLAMVKELVEEKLEEFRRGEYSPNLRGTLDQRTCLTNVYFERHLYQPLLSEPKCEAIVEVTPSGLNEGEKKFIEDLREYFRTHQEYFNGKEIYILRNLPRRGVGFYENTYFYPDFIIWVKDDTCQYLIFVDPHGAAHMYGGLQDEKVLLAQHIKKVEDTLRNTLHGRRVFLHSFIVSVSRYDEVRHIFNNKPMKLLEKKNILFQKDDPHYIAKIFRVLENT